MGIYVPSKPGAEPPAHPFDYGEWVLLMLGNTPILSGTVVARHLRVDGFGYVYDVKPDNGSAKRTDVPHDSLQRFSLTDREAVDQWLDL